MLWTTAAALQAGFSALCVSLVLLFIVLVCIPRLHVPVRTWLRPKAVWCVENGLSWCIVAQRYQSPLLTSLFTKSSHSVSVSFYASFLPMLFWLGLPELGRDLVLLMSLALYVGNAIKDLVCSPRPLGLRYGRLKLRLLVAGDEEIELNAKEYGLPSSHTLNTLCLNFFAAWYCHDRGLIAPGTAVVVYCLVAAWVLWIAASRLYLALHTPVDIIAGATAGLAVLVCFIAVEGLLSRWVFSGPWAVAHAALACLVLLRLYPRPAAHTPSFEFSTSFMGAMFGIVVGTAMTPAAHQPGIQLTRMWAGAGAGTLAGSRALWALRRLTAGFAVVLVCKEAARAVLLEALPFLYRFFPLSVRRLWQPPMHNLAKPVQAAAAGAGQRRGGPRTRGAAAAEQQQQQQQAGPAEATAAGMAQEAAAPINPRLGELPHNAKGQPWDVDVTSRFFAYASLGVGVAGITPRIFAALGW